MFPLDCTLPPPGGPISFRLLEDTQADMALLLAWLTTPEVVALAWAEGAPWDIHKICREFGRKARGERPMLAYIFQYEGRSVGYMQAYPLEQDAYSFTDAVPYSAVTGGWGMDMFIGYPHLWNRGIGSAAARMMRDWLIAHKGATCVCADPMEYNPRSVASWRKAGFTPLGKVPGYDEPDKWAILMVSRA